jgi:hypothetical protein
MTSITFLRASIMSSAGLSKMTFSIKEGCGIVVEVVIEDVVVDEVVVEDVVTITGGCVLVTTLGAVVVVTSS